MSRWNQNESWDEYGGNTRSGYDRGGSQPRSQRGTSQRRGYDDEQDDYRDTQNDRDYSSGRNRRDSRKKEGPYDSERIEMVKKPITTIEMHSGAWNDNKRNDRSYKNDYMRDGYDSSSETKHSDDDLIKHSSDEEEESHEEQLLTLPQACGLNTMNMFGTGPFITVPFVVAAVDPPGPHALIGYAMAAFACMNDSFVWSELGSMWPDSGGSYVYLRELYGRHTYGRLMAFLFVWQIMISGPMECASGFIATAQYIAYIDGDSSYIHHAGIGCAMCLLTVWALYREMEEVGTVTLVLWFFTICAIIFALIVGYANFDNEYIQTPKDAFDDGGRFFVSLGIAARFAVYDFTGYYDVNFVGKEVANPRENIPIACVVTCFVVAMVFFLIDVAIIGSLEWDPDKGGYVELVTSGSNSANYIMALFCETHISRGFAIFFTLIVCITIFGSCFSFMIGLAQIPYTAAKDGYFYVFLAHEHETKAGLSDYSLLFVGLLSTVFCFLDLELVIEGMLTMQLLIQFMSQGWGLIYYRYFMEDQEEASFVVPWFPIPNIIQLVIFGFIFATTENWIIDGGAPLLEVAMIFLIMGVVMYMLWAKKNGLWPYQWETYGSDDEELDHMVVYVADDGYEDELTVLKKKLARNEDIIRKMKYKQLNDLNRKEQDEFKERTIEALGKKDFRIIQLTKTLEDSERRVDMLEKQNVDLRNELHDIKVETGYEARETNNRGISSRRQSFRSNAGTVNQVKRNSVHSQKRVESFDDDANDVDTQQDYGTMLPVVDWTVDDVGRWWRQTCPEGAQKFLASVEECNVQGKDLLQLDAEMLQELGMQRILVMKVLKCIQTLKDHEANRKASMGGVQRSRSQPAVVRKNSHSRLSQRNVRGGDMDEGSYVV